MTRKAAHGAPTLGLLRVAWSGDMVVAFAARRLKRPVYWEGSRSEAFLLDTHGRGVDAFGEIEFDRNTRIVALRVRADIHFGADLSGESGSPINNIGGIAGTHVIPAILAEIDGIFSPMVPISASRGAGRPEATCSVERLIDAAARELGISPFALRRRNLIPPSAMPYKTAIDFNDDCCEFAGDMDIAERLVDLAAGAPAIEPGVAFKSQSSFKPLPLKP